MAALAPDSKLETPRVLYDRFFKPIEEKIKRLDEIVKDSYDGKSSVDWLTSAPIDTQAREYQREKVADLEFKQGIMISIIDKILGVGIVIIPMIHIRIVVKDGKVTFELIDGQQRVTSISDYLDPVNGYALPMGYKVGDLDLSGMRYKDLQSMGGEYTEIADKIKSYEISTAFYEGLTDQETSDLFVYKLNNTNNMNHQEIRNAILGALTRWIRNASRIAKTDGGDRHELFTTLIDTDKKVPYMKWFNLKVKDQRMERDQWLANLTYLALNGFKNGISSQDKVTKFYKETQSDDGKYKKVFTDSAIITKLLNLGLDICKTTPDKYESKLSAMNLTMMILYARDLQKRFGKINLDLFVSEWFRVGTEWNDTKLALYEGLFEANGKTPMKQFWANFNGINSNAINTICNVMDDNIGNVGIKIDSRDFTAKQIDDALIAQGGVDGWTGKPLKRKNAVGDHRIPRSAGIDAGGVTEPHNLVVTSDFNNRTKSNMDGTVFNEQMKNVA